MDKPVPEHARRAGGERGDGSRQRQTPRVDRREDQPESRFDPAHPVGGEAELDGFRHDRVGSVISGDGVRRSVGECRQARGGVVCRPQRWVHAQRRIVRRRDEGAVGPRVPSPPGSVKSLPCPAPGTRQPFVGEREVMRRDVAGDRQATRLRSTDEVQRCLRGEVGEMEPRPGGVRDDVGEDREIARDGRRLGRPRPAMEAEDGRDDPLGGLRAVGLLEVLGMIDDGQPGHPCVQERAAEEGAPADGRAIVREPGRARVGHLADRRQGLSRSSDGHRAIRQQANR